MRSISNPSFLHDQMGLIELNRSDCCVARQIPGGFVESVVKSCCPIQPTSFLNFGIHLARHITHQTGPVAVMTTNGDRPTDRWRTCVRVSISPSLSSASVDA